MSEKFEALFQAATSDMGILLSLVDKVSLLQRENSVSILNHYYLFLFRHCFSLKMVSFYLFTIKTF